MQNGRTIRGDEGSRRIPYFHPQLTPGGIIDRIVKQINSGTWQKCVEGKLIPSRRRNAVKIIIRIRNLVRQIIKRRDVGAFARSD
ncbi:hypothetical protein N9045_02575, partial [bacterium]|nr:hypothetical protein [bacterium]